MAILAREERRSVPSRGKQYGGEAVAGSFSRLPGAFRGCRELFAVAGKFSGVPESLQLLPEASQKLPEG